MRGSTVYNRTPPPPPNHLHGSEPSLCALGRPPPPPLVLLSPAGRLELPLFSPSNHRGVDIPWPRSCIHLGVSRVSMVFFTRWPRAVKKFPSPSSSADSSSRNRRLAGARAPAAAAPAPTLDGEPSAGEPVRP